MGSKGSNTQTTTSNNTSQYTANPLTQAAGAQALQYAQNAASLPFSAPLQGVQGFSPDQMQAFQQTRDQQGFAQPYYNQAASYFNQSANPITGAQVGNYLNPYANYVLGNLGETQKQQMQDVTGRLTQQAGGVGADRIAVGQSELARQQNLATGATLAGIYQPALAAAQQDAQRQAQAGYAFGNLGGQAQNSALQGTSALYNMGSQQQQLGQAGLNAAYNQQAAQAAYPYQQAQFLAGITGGLAPAFGGTTTSQGQSQTTRPPPNQWSQILGGGLGLAGSIFGGPLGGSIGSAIGKGAGNMFGGSEITNGGGLDMSGGNFSFTPSGSGFTLARGGRLSRDEGGRVNPFAEVLQFALQNRASGGRVKGYALGGPTFGDRFRGDVVGSPLSQQGFSDRFYGVPAEPDPSNFPGPEAGIFGGALPGGGAFPTSGGFPPSPMSQIDSRFPEATPPVDPAVAAQFQRSFALPPGAQVAQQMGTGVPSRPAQVADAGPVPTDNASARSAAPPGGPQSAPPTEPDGEASLPQNASLTEGEGLPYPDLSLKDDASRNMAKSPWTALARAGFAMAAGDSPFFGVNLGKGGLEGLKELDEQRKALREEEGVNQRARQLMLEVKKHQDLYSKMTPYQKESIRVAGEKTEAASEIARMKLEAAQERARLKREEDEKKSEEKANAPFTKAQLDVDKKRMIAIDAESEAAKKSLGALENIERMSKEAYQGPIAGRIGDVTGLNSAINTQAAELNLASAAFMKGNFSDKDLKFIQSATYNTKMPEDQAAQAIMLKRAAAERINLKNQFYREWFDKRRNLSGADKAWDRYVKENEMTVDDPKAPGGRRFNPAFNKDYSAYQKPRKGEVIGGYRYKGGPEDQESSWEKAR